MKKRLKYVFFSFLVILLQVIILIEIPKEASGQSASWNYNTQTGNLGTTYSWISASTGTNIVSGDDAVNSFNWPFSFQFYDDNYTSSNQLSVTTNGFIRLDGTATTDATTANNYNLTSTATNLGQIIALAVYDDQVQDNGGWCRYIVTGASPNRILTVEFNNVEIDYNDGNYADVQVSFYETTNKLVIKFGTENIGKTGVDVGIHSGVTGYFHKWGEIDNLTDNTWIEYTIPGPSLSVSPTSIAFGNVCINTTAGPLNFVINGTNLTNANVTVAALNGYTYSTTSGGTYTSSLSLSQGGGSYSQTIYVKFTPTAVQSYNGNIVVGGGGASNVNESVTGSGVTGTQTVNYLSAGTYTFTVPAGITSISVQAWGGGGCIETT